MRCKCGRSYRLRDEAIGKTLRCKSCGNKLRIPSDDATGDDNEFADALSDAVTHEQATAASASEEQHSETRLPPAKRRHAHEVGQSEAAQEMQFREKVCQIVDECPHSC